jgi:hypothetical protein
VPITEILLLLPFYQNASAVINILTVDNMYWVLTICQRMTEFYNTLKQVLLLPSFYRWGNWHLEMLSNFPRSHKDFHQRQTKVLRHPCTLKHSALAEVNSSSKWGTKARNQITALTCTWCLVYHLTLCAW